MNVEEAIKYLKRINKIVKNGIKYEVSAVDVEAIETLVKEFNSIKKELSDLHDSLNWKEVIDWNWVKKNEREDIKNTKLDTIKWIEKRLSQEKTC